MTTLQRRTGRAHARLLFRFAAVLGLALAAGAAWATGPQDFPTNEERDAIAELGFNPNDPLSVAAFRDEAARPAQTADDNTYVADPAFNGGKYKEDAFSSSTPSYFLGRKVAKLPDGSFVVAAMVKNPGGNQTNGFWNLGLVHYSATGSKQCWSAPGSYGVGNFPPGGGPIACFPTTAAPYVVYPKTDGATISWIQDVKVIDNFILVSANVAYSNGADTDTRVYVFNTDGKYLSFYSVFNSSADNEFIAGMEVYHTNLVNAGTNVVVVSNRFPINGAQVGKPIFMRLTLDSNGNLTAATSTVVLNYGVRCSRAAADCEAKGIALGYSRDIGANTHPAIFVAVAGRENSDFNAGALKINYQGAADANWPGKMWNMAPAGGTRDDIPFGIAVKSTGLGLPVSPRVHTVYVASNTTQECRPGISVLRMTTSDNGATGYSTLFGGSRATGTVCNFLKPAVDIGNGLIMQDGKLAIVGMRVSSPVCPIGQTCEDHVDSTFALVDDLTVKSFAEYDYQIGAPRSKHSGLYGVAGAGNGKFVVTGDDRYFNNDTVLPNYRGKQDVVVLGLAPPDNDTIFKNGFD